MANEAADATTATEPGSWRGANAVPAPTALHLVVAWSSVPGRVGEVAAVSRQALLGRGAARDDDPAPRLRFSRQRPGSNDATPSLDPERLSRQQLLLRPEGETGVAFERLGKCAVSLNGLPVERGLAREGDVLSLTDAVVFVVERRPKVLPAAWSAGAFARVPFGEADAFGMIGESAYAWALRGRLASLASDCDPVLVLGASGTGKELVARALHGLSRRSERALVSRNAATIPPALFDSELFGTQRNYPNAGAPERPGMIGEADGGTLYLDEVGELGTEQQAHLLRFLDGGEYHRLGEAKARRADVRFVAATNRDPSELKQDFLARFAKRIEARGLETRLADLPLFIAALVRNAAGHDPGRARFLDRTRLADGSTSEQARVHPGLVEALLRHDYQTHFRELRRLVGLALDTSPGDWLIETPAVTAELKPIPGAVVLDTAEIERALGACRGNVTQAAKALGLPNRYALYRLMRRAGLDPDR